MTAVTCAMELVSPQSGLYMNRQLQHWKHVRIDFVQVTRRYPGFDLGDPPRRIDSLTFLRIHCVIRSYAGFAFDTPYGRTKFVDQLYLDAGLDI